MRIAVLLLAILYCGCTDPKHRSYEHSIDREIDRFVFRRPIAEAWPELVGVLAENGFVLHEERPVEDRTLFSDLRPSGDGPSGYRAVVRVIRIDRASYKIRVDQQFTSSDGTKQMEPHDVGGRPVPTMMWTLIERVEPARAAKILEGLD